MTNDRAEALDACSICIKALRFIGILSCWKEQYVFDWKKK